MTVADRAGESSVAAGRTPRLVPLDGAGRSGARDDSEGDPDVVEVVASAGARLTRQQLLEQANVGSAFLVEIERYALVGPCAAGFYDSAAVRILTTIAALSDFGIEPRHLRAFRLAADREVGLLEQVVTPVRRGGRDDAGPRAREMAGELAELSATLHTLLVKVGMRDVAG